MKKLEEEKMKFKKLGTVVALVVSAVVLTACGTNDKENLLKIARY